MDFYLKVLNEFERASDDNPSIGIILCTEKDRLEVEFSLRLKANQQSVSGSGCDRNSTTYPSGLYTGSGLDGNGLGRPRCYGESRESG
jgi:hypothetical protein